MRVRTSTTDNYMKGSRSAERSFRVTVNHSKKDLDGYRINDSDFSINIAQKEYTSGPSNDVNFEYWTLNKLNQGSMVEQTRKTNRMIVKQNCFEPQINQAIINSINKLEIPKLEVQSQALNNQPEPSTELKKQIINKRLKNQIQVNKDRRQKQKDYKPSGVKNLEPIKSTENIDFYIQQLDQSLEDWQDNKNHVLMEKKYQQNQRILMSDLIEQHNTNMQMFKASSKELNDLVVLHEQAEFRVIQRNLTEKDVNCFKHSSSEVKLDLYPREIIRDVLEDYLNIVFKLEKSQNKESQLRQRVEISKMKINQCKKNQDEDPINQLNFVASQLYHQCTNLVEQILQIYQQQTLIKVPLYMILKQCLKFSMTIPVDQLPNYLDEDALTLILKQSALLCQADKIHEQINFDKKLLPKDNQNEYEIDQISLKMQYLEDQYTKLYVQKNKNLWSQLQNCNLIFLTLFGQKGNIIAEKILQSYKKVKYCLFTIQ